MHSRIWAAVLAAPLGVGAISGMGLATHALAQSSAQPMGEMKMQHPALPAGPLKISYAGKSAEWTAATLAALPHTSITVYNEHMKANQTYSGVPLSALLTQLGVPDKPHGKDLRLYLVAEGSDGYGVVFSIGEVTPDVHDGTTLVADAMDGKPLTDSGPLQLVTTGEKRPARWVHNLVSIRMLTAE